MTPCRKTCLVDNHVISGDSHTAGNNLPEPGKVREKDRESGRNRKKRTATKKKSQPPTSSALCSPGKSRANFVVDVGFHTHRSRPESHAGEIRIFATRSTMRTAVFDEVIPQYLSSSLNDDHLCVELIKNGHCPSNNRSFFVRCTTKRKKDQRKSCSPGCRIDQETVRTVTATAAVVCC